MNYTKKISVIMPTHNILNKKIDGEIAVESTLNSFLEQTLDSKELIIVDDSSSDDTVKYLERWVSNYDSKNEITIKVLSENRGPGGARNVGMSVASGEYVFFLDSDDIIPPDSLEILVNKAETWSSDYVLGSYDTEGRTKATAAFEKGDIPQAKLAEDNILGTVGPWSKLFRMDIIKENNLTFPENIFLYEDIAFLAGYLNYARIISVSVNKESSHYVLRRLDGSMSLITGGKKFGFNDRVRGLEEILKRIYSENKMLLALFFERLFAYGTIKDLFEKTFSNYQEQLIALDKFRETLIRYNFFSFSKYIENNSIRIRISYFVKDFDNIRKILLAGDFHLKFYDKWNKFIFLKNVGNEFDELMYAFNIERLISSIDFLDIEVISKWSLKIKNNSKLGVNNLIIVDRQNSSNFIRLKIEETEVEINIKNILSQFSKHGSIVDIYSERNFNGLISWQMIGAKNMLDLDETIFYKNWRNGLSFNANEI